MKKMIPSFVIPCILLSCSILAYDKTEVDSPKQQSRLISQSQVTADVSFLASDQMAGRQVFSKQLELAGDYISQRFKSIGLTPLPGSSDFKQIFEMTKLKPSQLNVEIDDKVIPPADITAITSQPHLNWQTGDPVKIITIGADDDFQAAIGNANNQAESVLALVHPNHRPIFERFKRYFDQGVARTKPTQYSAVIVITESLRANNFNIQIESDGMSQQLSNIVGVIPGKSLASEIVLFSAHYDHIGSDQKLLDDQIFNGADDDASGTTAVINLANYFYQQNINERTLMFVAFTAEEIGGFGSKYFAQKVNADKVVAMVNIEMIGKPSKFGSGTLWMTGFERSDLGDLMNLSLASFNKKIFADPYPEQRLFYRSDNATLARLGVPAHSFSSTQIDRDQHYHQVTDEVKTLDLDSMTQVIEQLALGSETLASGKSTPKRLIKEEISKTGYLY